MLGDDLTEWAAELSTALELPVEVDPRDLVIPGILVVPGVIDFDRLDAGTASVDIELWLVAGDTNPTVALNELTGMLMKLRRHLVGTPTEVVPIAVTLAAQSPDPLPAFRCPIPLEISFT